MSNRFVGILLNTSIYKGIPFGKTKFEKLRLYEEAGRKYGVTPCYFRLQDIRPGQTNIKAYVREASGYTLKWVPLPSVIHNRAHYFQKGPRMKIERLVQSGIQIFNKSNRYGKLKIHELLMLNKSVRPHLPETVKATPEELQRMMAQHESLILKPNSSSIGKGVMKLDRTETGWKISYRAAKGSFHTRYFQQNIPKFVVSKLRAGGYMIQQRLPLATYMDRPFDLRVSVQRDDTGGWQVTGIAGKVAKKDAFLTNLAQGGTVHSLQTFLQQYPHLQWESVRSDIESFSLMASEHLGRYLPNLADIGLDIGITEYGFPMFIECNGRDLRVCFEKGNMMKEWKDTYKNPIGYAHYLMNRHTSN